MLSSFPGGSSFPRHRSVAWREGLALEGSNVIPSHACVPGLASRMVGRGHEVCAALSVCGEARSEAFVTPCATPGPTRTRWSVKISYSFACNVWVFFPPNRTRQIKRSGERCTSAMGDAKAQRIAKATAIIERLQLPADDPVPALTSDETEILVELVERRLRKDADLTVLLGELDECDSALLVSPRAGGDGSPAAIGA